MTMEVGEQCGRPHTVIRSIDDARERWDPMAFVYLLFGRDELFPRARDARELLVMLLAAAVDCVGVVGAGFGVLVHKESGDEGHGD
jgi:hypothetical protein